MRWTSRWLIAALVATFALALAPSAFAGAQLGGGATTLSLDPAVGQALGSLGVSVAPISPAKAGRSGISFPITGGNIHPSTAVGRIEHSGGLRFSAGGKKLDVRNFNVRVASDAFLTAQVGGARVKLLTLDLAKAKVKRSGFDTRVSGVTAALTGTAARALNATFAVKAFKKGLVIGKVKVSAKFAEVLIKGGSTSLVLDPTAAGALTSLGVSVGPVSPAGLNGDGSIGFPITKGRVDAKTLVGFINHSGGLAFTKGSTRVELTNFRITIGANPTLSAVLGGTRVDILTLDLARAKIAISDRNVAVGPVIAKLTKGAADALNAAFGTTALTDGLTIGVANVAAEGR